MLMALANTSIRVIVSIPNNELLGAGQSNVIAANWVSRNVVAHVPATNINAVAIGSEVPTSFPNAALVLVFALQFIHSTLAVTNLDSQIKVSAPHSSATILDSFPPSQAFFNHLWNSVLVPMLKFLESINSSLLLNVYPYYDYMQSNGIVMSDDLITLTLKKILNRRMGELQPFAVFLVVAASSEGGNGCPTLMAAAEARIESDSYFLFLF
ncbi:hypothetical protein AAC387_Pa05g2691 [Persea americana]